MKTGKKIHKKENFFDKKKKKCSDSNLINLEPSKIFH
jgi:hypothetical protein